MTCPLTDRKGAPQLAAALSSAGAAVERQMTVAYVERLGAEAQDQKSRMEQEGSTTQPLALEKARAVRHTCFQKARTGQSKLDGCPAILRIKSDGTHSLVCTSMS